MTEDPQKLKIIRFLPEVFRVESPKNGTKFEREDVHAVLQQFGIEVPSSELLHDFIMVAGGLPVKEDEEISSALSSLVRRQRGWFDPRRWGFRDQERADAIEYNLYVADFLRRINRKSLPGRTDMDKALSMAMIAEEVGKAIEGGTNPEELAQRVDAAFQSAIDLTPEELATLAGLPHPTGALVRQDGPDPDDDSKTEILNGRPTHRSELLERDPARNGFKLLRHNMKVGDVAARLISDQKLGKVIEVARVLRGRAGLGTSKSSKLIEDKFGSEYRVSNIRTVEEIPLLLASERMIGGLSPELLLQRIVNGDALVRRRASRIKKRQLLYCLIDGSGSMRCGKRIQIAAGVMMNRLSAVAKGDGVLFYRFFDAILREEDEASDPDDVSRHLRRVLSFPYDVEETNLQEGVVGSLQRIYEIEEEGEFDRPHLLIISDGDAKFEIPATLLRGTVVHAVLIEGENESIAKLVTRTGGVLIKM